MTQPIILVSEGSDPKPLAWLKENAQVLEIPYDSPAFGEALAQAQGLVVRTYTRVNAELLSRAPKLKVVGRGGVGLENIDVKTCRERGVEVVYTPCANTLAVGDFVFGYILQLLRPWCFFKDAVYAPKEFKRIRDSVRGRQLNELTLGILGMGRVGRRVATIASGFGMRILYNDLRDVARELPFGAISVDKPTLYRESDILTLHVDMRPENHNLVDASAIAMMKKDAVLINTSRGEVLDVHALAMALKQNRLYGAAIDVFSPEPPKEDFPLLGMDRVLLTPHLAARTQTALDNMSWVVKDVLGVLRGEKPMYPAP